MEYYTYEGAVLNGFNRIINNKWKGLTYAKSDKKAKSNLIYQFKKQYGLTPSAKVILHNEPTKILRENNTSYYEKTYI